MKFEVWKSGKLWYWHLQTANGENIAHGQGYKRKADCLACVKLLKAGDVKVAPVDILK